MTDTTLTAEQKQAALIAFGKSYGNAVTQPVGCFGCAVQIIGIVLVVWLLTHISVIWAFLDRIVR